jgi:type IV pilus assembly protein PilE
MKLNKKLEAFNLQETLVVLAIIGILLLLVLPNLMPLISRTKSLEAQIQLKALYNSEKQYRYIYSKYANDIKLLDVELPATINNGGQANYSYELIEATPTKFTIQAKAVVDFDGDGIYNQWQIDQNGSPIEIVKD